MRPTVAFVTGCAGFIGSHLTEALLDQGTRVLGVDCFNDNYARGQKLANLQRAQEWDDFEFIPLDLARGQLQDLVEEVDVVFHLAAEPGVRASWGQRFSNYVRNNLEATQHLLEAAMPWPDRRFVYASSSSVYGQTALLPTPETAPCRPFSPYGVTKLAAENMAMLYHDNHGLQTVALRFFTVYGPRQRPDMAFRRFCEAVLRDQDIHIFGDGEQTRDFTYVADVVDALLAAGSRPGVAGKAYNIGGGHRISVNTTLRHIGECAGRTPRAMYKAVEHGDVRQTAADTSLAREELGFAPATELAEGIQREFEWVCQQSSAADPRALRH